MQATKKKRTVNRHVSCTMYNRQRLSRFSPFFYAILYLVPTGTGIVETSLPSGHPVFSKT